MCRIIKFFKHEHNYIKYKTSVDWLKIKFKYFRLLTLVFL